MNVVKYLKNPKEIVVGLCSRGNLDMLNDEKFLKALYWAQMGKRLDLKNPQTFNEKLQWLKLYDRCPEYTVLVDKYAVRKYIAKTIGEKYLIPLLGVWDDPEDIDFDKLPNQFVLKCNHNSGLGMCICKDKSTLNVAYVKCELRKGLSQNYYFAGREWPYKNVPPKIVAEKYMEDGSGELQDYKLMCFNGKVKCIFTCTERYTEELRVTFFDLSWNRLPFKRHYSTSIKIIPPPSCLSEMIRLAEILSENVPFMRVDFYEVEKKLYFGELTFYPGSGLEEFDPEEWDYTLGGWLHLPKIEERI